MDTLKAILNQILLSFDAVADRIKELPAKGRRRIMLLAAIFLLLVILLLILCVSSCHNTGAAATAEAVESGIRTRVRGKQSSDSGSTSWGGTNVRLYSDNQSGSGDSTSATQESTAGGQENTSSDPGQTAGGSDGSAGNTSENGSDTSLQYATLKKHDKSDAVTVMQYRLMELGYLDIDEPTNYFGTSTETAVILFQRQHDLKQDGVAGNETQTILYSDDAEHYCLKEGADGQDVKALQEQLVDLGYLSEKDVDRVYGPVTIAAVEAFQKRNGLHVDGLAGEKTLELLYSEKAKISKDLQKQQEAEAAAKKKAEEEAKKKAEEEAKKKSSSSSKTTKTTAKATKKPTATPKKDTRIDKFINAANSKIGCEYVLGAKGPNKFDCSGLVYYCLKQAGVGGTRLNAQGYSQRSGWKKIESIGSLKRGDILFFRSDSNSSVNHTGIYVGGGNMIDASSGNGKVMKRPLSAYWKRNFVCARRPWSD